MVPSAMAMEKEKALEMALSQIEKQFGKGAVMKLGDAAAKISVSTIPSGCLELDFALGAVSYTHLDVYKRQDLPDCTWPLFRGEPVF